MTDPAPHHQHRSKRELTARAVIAAVVGGVLVAVALVAATGA